MPPDIGEVIRYIREESGYTMKYLADCCGITRQTIGRIEKNTGHANIKSVEAILSALGYMKVKGSERLVKGTEKPNNSND